MKRHLLLLFVGALALTLSSGEEEASVGPPDDDDVDIPADYGLEHPPDIEGGEGDEAAVAANEAANANAEKEDEVPPSDGVSDDERCEGCQVLTELVTESIGDWISEMKAQIKGGEQRAKEIFVGKFVRDECYEYKLKGYTIGIISACNWFFHYMDPVKDLFGAGEPKPEDIFERKKSICVDTLKTCNANVFEDNTSTPTTCQSCIAVVQSAEKIMDWQRLGQNFATKTHVSSVLNDLCAKLPWRYPVSVAYHYQQVCDQLFDDYEDEFFSTLHKQLPNAAKIMCADHADLCPSYQFETEDTEDKEEL